MNAPRRAAPHRSGRGGTLLGIFIGLVLGIVLAAVVALYVTGGWKAYQNQVSPAKDPGRDAAKVASADPKAAAKAEADKPRFDFYKILPSGEEPKVAPPKPAAPKGDAATVKASEPAKAADKANEKSPEKVAAADPKLPDRFYLQAGSFLQQGDAENMKARLALAGWEAQVQVGNLPDRTTRYRVRLGPYDNVDELNRIKGELARRGFEVAVIRP